MLSVLSFDQWMTIHGIMMLVAWGILAPAGIYIARYKREELNRTRGNWFPYHRGIMLTTVLLSSAATGIAFAACSSHFNRPHKIIAPILNIMMILVMTGGFFAHLYRDGSMPAVNMAHKVCGRLTLLLAWINTAVGIYDHPSWPATIKICLVLVYYSVLASVFGQAEWSKRRHASRAD